MAKRSRVRASAAPVKLLFMADSSRPSIWKQLLALEGFVDWAKIHAAMLDAAQSRLPGLEFDVTALAFAAEPPEADVRFTTFVGHMERAGFELASITRGPVNFVMDGRDLIAEPKRDALRQRAQRADPMISYAVGLSAAHPIVVLSDSVQVGYVLSRAAKLRLDGGGPAGPNVLLAPARAFQQSEISGLRGLDISTEHLAVVELPGEAFVTAQSKTSEPRRFGGDTRF